jgi:hypothetical protein
VFVQDLNIGDVVMNRYDIAVAMDVPMRQGRRLVDKKVWRIGNVEGIRVLKKDPRNKDGEVAEDLSSFETESHPPHVSVDDPRAVFLVRWYKECDDDGHVLDGFQHPSYGCHY